MGSLSLYRSYLDFVREVGEICGFKVEQDILRIPSTKKVLSLFPINTVRLIGLLLGSLSQLSRVYCNNEASVMKGTKSVSRWNFCPPPPNGANFYVLSIYRIIRVIRFARSVEQGAIKRRILFLSKRRDWSFLNRDRPL